ncbi:MAG: hypothetical protein WD356_03070, partial [Pseudomonadales bacterium]
MTGPANKPGCYLRIYAQLSTAIVCAGRDIGNPNLVEILQILNKGISTVATRCDSQSARVEIASGDIHTGDAAEVGRQFLLVCQIEVSLGICNNDVQNFTGADWLTKRSGG